MIEVLDKNHFEIKGHIKNSGICFVSFFNNRTGIYFSSGAVKRFNLDACDSVHFKNENNKLFFKCSNEINNGFTLCKTNSKRDRALKVTSFPLMTALLKRFKLKFNTKYFLLEHEDGYIQILLNK